jgi:hypothetical protein
MKKKERMKVKMNRDKKQKERGVKVAKNILQSSFQIFLFLMSQFFLDISFLFVNY